ncbi:MAG: sensor histidine kinase, partial [Anaerolineae bacterium]|nr:sensor histidine kinase [Anaerolineae bacterium]
MAPMTATITIRDVGIGMSDEELSHIFERFYRVDDAHSTPGFGLGLPIAARVIELHHGDIHVE